MSSHGDEMLFEILCELREIKEFIIGTRKQTLQELGHEQLAAEKAEEGED